MRDTGIQYQIFFTTRHIIWFSDQKRRYIILTATPSTGGGR